MVKNAAFCIFVSAFPKLCTPLSPPNKNPLTIVFSTTASAYRLVALMYFSWRIFCHFDFLFCPWSRWSMQEKIIEVTSFFVSILKPMQSDFLNHFSNVFRCSKVRESAIYEKARRKSAAIWSCFAGGIFRMTQAWGLRIVLVFNWREKICWYFPPRCFWLNIWRYSSSLSGKIQACVFKSFDVITCSQHPKWSKSANFPLACKQSICEKTKHNKTLLIVLEQQLYILNKKP